MHNKTLKYKLIIYWINSTILPWSTSCHTLEEAQSFITKYLLVDNTVKSYKIIDNESQRVTQQGDNKTAKT